MMDTTPLTAIDEATKEGKEWGNYPAANKGHMAGYQAAVMKSGDPELALRFALEVPNANMRYLGRMIEESGDADIAIEFAAKSSIDYFNGLNDVIRKNGAKEQIEALDERIHLGAMMQDVILVKEGPAGNHTEEQHKLASGWKKDVETTIKAKRYSLVRSILEVELAFLCLSLEWSESQLNV